MVEKNIMKPRMAGVKREPKEFDERVIEVRRVSRVVKGGRRIRFRALVAIGDHKGRVGMGVAKASEVSEAVRKATVSAKKNLITVPVINGTIPHEIRVKFGSAKIFMKPATPGTTIVAGGSVRIVAELAGITDLLSKIMGSSNKINNVSATIHALSSFDPRVVAKVSKYSSAQAVITKLEPEVAVDESVEGAIEEAETVVEKEETPAKLKSRKTKGEE